MAALLDLFDTEMHYNVITRLFPAVFFGLIVAYLYCKDRHKRGL
jgi:hypothetical protein